MLNNGSQEYEKAQRLVQQQIAKETNELQTDKNRIHDLELEVPELTHKNDALRKEIDVNKSKIFKDGQEIPKLKSDVHKIEEDLRRKHTEMERARQQNVSGMRKAGIKDIHLN